MTVIAVSITALAVVVLAALNASANTPAEVQGASEVYAESAAFGALTLFPCLALPMVIVTLLYGIFAAPSVSLRSRQGRTSEQSGDENGIARPAAAIRDLTTFRLQVEAQIAAATRERLRFAFIEGAPVAARFETAEGELGTFICERVGASSGVCVSWLINFSDGQRTVIEAREDALLQAIRAWQESNTQA